MINVIPIPMEVIEKEGRVQFEGSLKCYFDKAFGNAKRYFDTHIASTIIDGVTTARKAENAVVQYTIAEDFAKEEYAIDITATAISVRASTDVGALYATVTLCQLVGAYTRESSTVFDIPVVSIHDKPRYDWRGVLLDVSRHFYGVDDVKRIMDNMLLHKLNVLHLHLTDDQGWRIEIKKYPLLTEVGSKRKWTQIHGWGCTDPEKDIERVEHSGYYTQDDIRELVAYATQCGIMVVPEIDMPAHFRAAMAGYPMLQCDDSIKRDVPWYFGTGFATYDGGNARDTSIIACAGKESTYEFIEDILAEVSALFPAPYFHIGGDEAPKSEWEKCPFCQQKMKEEHLESLEELQGYFNNRVVEMLKKYNKTLIVWNEALEGGNLDISTIGQYWTPTRDKNAEDYANKKGGKLILSKHSSFYFDMCYGQVPLQSTYNFDSKNVGINEEAEGNIMGVEGTLWTEWIDSMEKMEFNSNPRFAALSEVGWSLEKNKSLASFLKRLEAMEEIYSKLGIRYACTKVALNKNPIRRLREMSIWNKNNKHHEMTEDVKYRNAKK